MLTRTFRLFISSTFADFGDERAALQERVFPKLRELCERRGARFEVVDLRWGISAEARKHHETMRVCLEEIRRSQELSPRPNFVALLGDRYGWQPLPARIPEGHWNRMLAGCPEADRQAILAAYEDRLDENAVPPVYCVRQRRGDGSFQGEDERRERAALAALRRAALRAGLSAEERVPYEASSTHQEIVLGALEKADAQEHVHVYLRRIDGLPDTVEAKAYLDWIDGPDGAPGAPDSDARKRLDALKAQLVARLGDQVHELEATWGSDGKPTNAHRDAFCDAFYAHQAALIQAELDRTEHSGDDPHAKFAQERARIFRGRGPVLERIETYLSEPEPEAGPLVLLGAGGSGKSAVMAQALLNARPSQEPKPVILPRFIGGVPGVESLRGLLASIEVGIAALGVEPSAAEGEQVDEEELSKRLERVLRALPEDRALWIFLDALDQLETADEAHRLEWLPKSLPAHVRIVVSVRDGEIGVVARSRFRGHVLELPTMTRDEGADMLQAWLDDSEDARFNAGAAPSKGRRLTDQQRCAVLDGFAENHSPLWMRLAFEEARSWHAWTPAPALPATVEGMVKALLARLVTRDRHLPLFTRRALAYLCAARFGLSEDELASALGRDPEVRQEFDESSKKTPWESRDLLPPILWARLRSDLAPYLSTAFVDGAALMRFFHREFHEVLSRELLGGDDGQAIHRRLADTFERLSPGGPDLFRKTDAGADSHRSTALRRVMEQPWQLARAGDHGALEALLTDFGFVMAKCAANRSNDLFSDFASGQIARDKDLRWAAWSQFMRTHRHLFSRSTSHWPGHRILLQVAAEQEPTHPVAQAAERWLRAGQCDWLWLRGTGVRSNRVTDVISVMEAHQRKLTHLDAGDGFNSGFRRAAADRVLTWALDKEINVWEPRSGRLVSSFRGHVRDAGLVSEVVCLSKGRVLSLARLGKRSVFRVWDQETGQSICSIEGATAALPEFRILSDERILIYDAPLMANTAPRFGVFDLETGQRIHGFTIGSRRFLVLGASATEVVYWDRTRHRVCRVETESGKTAWSQPVSNKAHRVRWDAASGEIALEERDVVSDVTCLKLRSGQSFRWDIPRRRSQLHIVDADNSTMLSVSDHGSAIAGALELSNGAVLMWTEGGEVARWQCTGGLWGHRTLLGHAGPLDGAVALPDGGFISWSGVQLCRWAADLDVPVCRFGGHGRKILQVEVDATGNTLSWDAASVLRYWRTSESVGGDLQLTPLSEVTCAARSVNECLVAGDQSGDLMLVSDVWPEPQIVRRAHSERVSALLVLRCGRVASASTDMTVKVWEVVPHGGGEQGGRGDTLRLVFTLTAHRSEVAGLIQLARGELLTWSMDGQIAVWCLKSGELLRMAESGPVVEAKALPDGRFLLVTEDALSLWSAEGVRIGLLDRLQRFYRLDAPQKLDGAIWWYPWWTLDDVSIAQNSAVELYDHERNRLAHWDGVVMRDAHPVIENFSKKHIRRRVKTLKGLGYVTWLAFNRHVQVVRFEAADGIDGAAPQGAAKVLVGHTDYIRDVRDSDGGGLITVSDAEAISWSGAFERREVLRRDAREPVAARASRGELVKALGGACSMSGAVSVWPSPSGVVGVVESQGQVRSAHWVGERGETRVIAANDRGAWVLQNRHLHFLRVSGWTGP